MFVGGICYHYRHRHRHRHHYHHHYHLCHEVNFHLMYMRKHKLIRRAHAYTSIMFNASNFAKDEKSEGKSLIAKLNVFKLFLFFP